ncbi:restriction endonuclease subunit S [Cellulophaga fucicola]|uniref:Type I restriction enzyme, S subunit n=1 Tax=Cellulophaga fucicola TaxID=76595 RepID=A0A1K1ML48_9FLAO|nr:restriction endonuclease subunit S [Cellulophaga fucicola]SFW23876.1 type I restriction enzyme, S subunit [Cellulophaga fucicola]
MREDWIEAALGEAFETVTGNTPSKKDKDNYGSEIPFIKPPQINNNFLKTSAEFLSAKGKIKARILPINSVLVTCIGNLGRIGINKKEVAFNQQINAIKPIAGIDPKYTFYQAQSVSFRNQLEKLSTSTTVALVNKTSFNSVKFKIAPLPIQKAIVNKIEELFSSLDSGIADLKIAQEQLVIYRQAVLKKAFEGELTKEWREKQTDLPSAYELLEQIETGRQIFYNNQIEEWEIELKRWKETGEVGKKPKKPRPLTIPDAPNNGHNERKWVIPNNWVWAQIGSLCFVTKLAGFEYTDYVNYDEDGDLPVLKAENAGTNGFKKTDFSKVKSESVKILKRSQIFGGELLIVFVGAGTGNVAMVPFNQRYFLGPNIGMARPYFDLNSKYLELFLQSAFGKSLMMSAVKAVAQPSLSMGTIRQAPIAFPSLEEQHQIVQEIESRLSVCDTVEKDIADSLEKSQALRQSILKKAFEGKLLSEAEIAKCKADKNYEPASVLLQKIKAEKKKK